MEARNRPLEDWLKMIGRGQLQLPRFQRFEAWGHSDVTALLQTVVDGLPAGATLVLQIGDKAPFKYRPLETAPDGSEKTIELLLDGQQRLTALWRSLEDTYDDRTFFVDLFGDEESDGPSVVSQHRYEKNGKRYPLWADEPTKVLERGLLPVRLLRPGDAGEQEFYKWLEEATDGELESKFKLQGTALQLRSKVGNYNLPYLFLDSQTEKSVILDVFVKMNTRLVKLSAFDIVVADVEGETGESLHDLVASLQGQVPALERYIDLPDLVLDTVALMQDRSPTRSGYFGIDWDQAIGDWESLVTGSASAVQILEQLKVLDRSRLPTRPALAPLVALCTALPTDPDSLGNAKTLLRRYLWMSFFTDRYERSASTSALQDYRALKPAVTNGHDKADAPALAAELPDPDELLDTRWPKRRDRLARAVLLVSLQGGAYDIADGAEITPENVRQREYHHLFPRAYLKEHGVDETDIDTVLNCALITWRTNRKIAANDPVDYLLDRANNSALGMDQLRHYLASHAIPVEPMLRSDYDDFRLTRAEIVAEAMRELSSGSHWAPGSVL